MNLALVRFLPGQDFPAHRHNEMEENFYILSGVADIVVDGETHTLSPGQMIHIEPGEVHYVVNRGDEPVRMVAALAPYREADKEEVPDERYKGRY